MKTAQDNLALALTLGDVFWVADILHEKPQEVSQHLYSPQLYAVKAPYEVTSLHPYCSFVGLELIENFLLKTQSLSFPEDSLRTTQALRKPYSSYWASEEFFYQRMKVLVRLVEEYPNAFNGLLPLNEEKVEENNGIQETKKTAPPHKREEKMAHFLSLLIRQYSCDEWGNIEAASLKESRCRQEILETFLKHPVNFGVDSSLYLLKIFSYERCNVFALMCQKGVFDEALKDDPVATKNNLLVTLPLGRTGPPSPLYVLNLPNRSFLLKRAIELGVIDKDDCIERGFSLFDVLWDAGGATQALMEQGLRLPRMAGENLLDGKSFTYYPRFTVEQIKQWQRYDRDGLLCSLLKSGRTESLEKAINDLFDMYNVFFADKSRFSSQDQERKTLKRFLFQLFEESKSSFTYDAIWQELHKQGHMALTCTSEQNSKGENGSGKDEGGQKTGPDRRM